MIAEQLRKHVCRSGAFAERSRNMVLRLSGYPGAFRNVAEPETQCARLKSKHVFRSGMFAQALRNIDFR